MEKRSRLTLVALSEIDTQGKMSVVLAKETAQEFAKLPGGVLKGIGCPGCCALEVLAEMVKVSSSEILADESVKLILFCAKAYKLMHPEDETYGEEAARTGLACGREREPFDVYVPALDYRPKAIESLTWSALPKNEP